MNATNTAVNNTEASAITTPDFCDRDSYLAFRAAWRRACHEKTVKFGPEHYALYAALRGRDWRKCFAPCTNTRKLDNGHPRWSGLKAALSSLEAAGRREHFMQLLCAPFQGTVDLRLIEVKSAKILAEGKDLLAS